MGNSFQLKIMATNWGFEGSLESFCARVKEEGYNGIETWWPLNGQDQQLLFSLLNKYQLDVGFLVASHEGSFLQHLDGFRKMVDAAASNKLMSPLYINCHSGKDYFDFEENMQMIDHTVALAKETGVRICHETHRSRMLYAAPIAKKFIACVPGLRITLDASHWCNVHESLLQDQAETMDLVLARTDHIHARIGHAEGPQINDPRAPEWEDAVNAHFNWWDKVVSLKKQNAEVLTILTEFGPPDYMPVLPHSRKPVADQWAINVYMMHRLRERYL